MFDLSIVTSLVQEIAGQVRDRKLRALIEELAERIEEVYDSIPRLYVGPEEPEEARDGDMWLPDSTKDGKTICCPPLRQRR